MIDLWIKRYIDDQIAQAISDQSRQIRSIAAASSRAVADAATALALASSTASVLTTKGDILTYGSVYTRLPVGTSNGLALVVDNTTSTGLKWGSVASSGTTYTQGSVPFGGPSGTLIEDNTKLFWDNSSKYLGVGTNTPQTDLHTLNDSVTPITRISSVIKGSGINTAEIQLYEGASDYWSIIKRSSLYTDRNDLLTFEHYNGLGSTSVLSITKNGWVGIGNSIPSQTLDIVGSIELLNTDISASGVIYKGSSTFIHDFTAADSEGKNTFVGINAGNFTMFAPSSYDASRNTGVGIDVLKSLTVGRDNTATGVETLRDTTEGSFNCAFGKEALSSLVDGDANCSFGSSALYSLQTGDSNIAIGSAGIDLINGSYNVFIGDGAGFWERGSNKLYIHNASSATTEPLICGDFDSQEIVFTGYTTCSGILQVKSLSGYLNSGYITETAAVQSSDATPTNMYVLETDTNTAYWIEANVIAREESGLAHAHFKRSAMVTRVGGAPTMSTVTALISDYEAGSSTWDLLLGLYNNWVMVDVVGSGSTNVNWAATINYQAVSGVA
jgi:hypothetical protein